MARPSSIVFARRLFDVDIFAGLTGVDGRKCVPMIGSRDEDGVDVFAIEDATEIAAGVGTFAAEFFDGACGFCGTTDRRRRKR